MRPRFIIISFLWGLYGFTTILSSMAQPPEIEWSRRYGGTESEMANSVCATSDGGYIFAGYTKSFNADSNDVYLVKTDSLGNIQWYQLYGGSDYDDAQSVQETSDVGYILAGRTRSYGAGSNDMYVLKTDSEGDTLWSRTYGGVDSDIAYSVQQTFDGGYIIAGHTTPYAGAITEIYLVKTDSLGDTLWTRSYAHDNGWLAHSVQRTSDGGYIIAGNDSYYSGVEYHIYLLKTDSLGDTLWTRTYGGNDDDLVRMVQQTTDRGYIVAGWTDSYGAGYGDFYAVKTDSLGDTLWTRTYGGSDGDGAYSVQQTPDGGYILAGITYSFGVEHCDMYLVRTDGQGDTLWTLVYAAEGYDMITSLDQTSDGGYIVAGYTYPSYFEPADCWLVKTGPDTAVSGAPSIQWVSHPKDFILHPAYPNPFNASTALTYSIPTDQTITLKIHNILGQQLATLFNGTQQPGIHTIIWNATDHASGIYFATLSAPNHSQTRKIVLLK